MSNPIIGISGVATSGKDTFGKLLIELLAKKGYEARRFALADELKKQVAPFILNEYGINIFDCSLAEKTLVRPILVAHGEIKRETTEGTYWLSLLGKEIERVAKLEPNVIPVVTDVRYAFYPNDELYWIREKHGLIVHVQRYVTRVWQNVDEDQFEEQEVIQPANETEAKHNGALREKADYKVNWMTSPDPSLVKIEDWCRSHVSEFIRSDAMKELLTRCTKSAI